MSDKDKKILEFNKRQKHEDKRQPIEYCSFCKRPNTEVIKMVKGPDVNICSECTMIALQYLILQDGVLSKEAQKVIDAFWGMKS